MINRMLAALALAALGAAGVVANGQHSTARVSSAPSSTATAAYPGVVELFQSQGCSSCPPANANANALADRKDLIVLNYGVTIWDQLGWKDSFASPAFTARHRDYAAKVAHSNQVYTPQTFINGRITVIGSDRAELARTIARQGSAKGGPEIALTDTKASLSGPSGKGATIWLVRFDPKVRQVAIRAGENSGRTLPHRNVVRQMIRLGTYGGAAARYSLPAASERGLSSAILVQQGVGGPILSARRS